MYLKGASYEKKIMTMVLLILALALVSTGAFATVISTSALSAQTSLEEKVIGQSRGVFKFIEPEKEM